MNFFDFGGPTPARVSGCTVSVGHLLSPSQIWRLLVERSLRGNGMYKKLRVPVPLGEGAVSTSKSFLLVMKCYSAKFNSSSWLG